MKFLALSFLFCCFMISRSVARNKKMCGFHIIDPGFCRNRLLKWIHEAESNKCIEFEYGGCWPLYDYETEEECKQNCIK